MSSKRSYWEIYNKQMSQLNLGDALWEPAPLPGLKRIQPGDVGYIRRGCFYLLFSAGCPLEEVRLGVDVPRTFKQLDVGPIINTQPRSPGYLSTSTVRETPGRLRAPTHPNPMSEPGSSISFRLTGDQGAALLTKHLTYREDVRRERIFERYTKEHYNSWVTFAREAGDGDDIKPVLITGVDMTRDFAMITYSNGDDDLTSEFTISVPGVASPWGTWRTTGAVYTNCGPQPCRPPSPPQSVVDSSYTETVSDGYNQCVFIRYYTMRKRLGFPRIIKAAAGPHDLGSGARGDEASPPKVQSNSDLGSGSDSGSGSDIVSSLFDDDEVGSLISIDSESDMVIHNITADEMDDFDTVADYIFRNSGAESALIHHQDIALLRKSGGSASLFTRLFEKQPPVTVDENGVGTIGDHTEPSVAIPRRHTASGHTASVYRPAHWTGTEFQHLRKRALTLDEGHQVERTHEEPPRLDPRGPSQTTMVRRNSLPPQPDYLQPRPFQQNAGSILLVPLLPHRETAIALPAEIWTEIFVNVYYGGNVDPTPNMRTEQYRRDLLLISKSLTNIVLPVFYSRVWIESLVQLDRFTATLHGADKRWDSSRKMPYSVPGRWVRDLDLSGLDCRHVGLDVDELLTKLFPLLPFMTAFVLNTTMTLSRRALAALSTRDGCQHLKALKGIKAPITYPTNQSRFPAPVVDSDPLVQLIRNSVHLEELEIHGPGFDSLETDLASLEVNLASLGVDCVSQSANVPPPVQVDMEGEESGLKLNSLTSLSILSTHASPLMLTLLLSELPSLQHLVVTPYDDLPYPASLVSKFIQTHGSTLRSLHLYTPKDTWPTVSHPSPSDILLTCPNLTHLSLESPLPELKIPPPNHLGNVHPLQTLSVPRPSRRCYQTVSTVVSSLQNLRVVRTRDVRWLQRGIASQSMETGTQGEMREWKRRFALRGVDLLDAEMNRDDDDCT